MKKIDRVFLCAACIALMLTTLASAAGQLPVMNAYTTQDGVTLFVRNQGAEVEQVYVGNDACPSFTTSEMGPTRTLVVLDNSQSIPEDQREGIKAFLTELVAARSDGDVFTLATFDQEVTYLTQDDNDYLSIKGKINAIAFVDQVSYFTNTVYKVLSDLVENDAMMYTRLIIIADGAENEALGFTDDELYQKIQIAHIPIYAIGFTTGNNEENLERMFSLSRMSSGKDYLIGDISFAGILQDLGREEETLRVDITPPQELCDGTEQAIRVNFEGGSFASAEVVMPFQASVEPEPNPSVPPEEPPVQVGPERNWMPIIAVAVLGAAVIIVFIVAAEVKKGKKRDKRTDEPVDLSGIGHSSETVLIAARKGDHTELLDGGYQQHTSLLNDQRRDDMRRLRLEDLSNPAKVFECSIHNRLLIGADPLQCHIVISYDKYVSSVHCEVAPKDGGFVVRDGADGMKPSTNGTYVNDQKVSSELPLPDKSVLRLGALKFRVTIL